MKKSTNNNAKKGKKLGLNQQKANFLHLHFHKIKNCAYMNKLLAMSFLVGFFISALSAQATQNQDELKAAFKRFERQLKKNKADLNWSGQNQQWFENDCPFLQLKWVKIQKKGKNNYTIEAGDDSVLDWCAQMNNKNVAAQQQELRERWSALGAGKKYAIYVDTFNANREGILRKEYYYECSPQQDSLKVLFIKAREEKLLAEQKKRDSLQLQQAKWQEEMAAKDTLKTYFTQIFSKDSQDSLMIEFQQFVRQMEQNKDLVFNSSHFPNHSAEVEKNCELYQLRWSYFCMPGGRVLVIKGDSTTLSFCQFAKETAKKGAMIGPYSGYSASPDGKYVVWGYSVPMGTCDDRFYYYERVDKK